MDPLGSISWTLSGVNLEADIIGKYVEKLLGKEDAGPGLMDLLKQEGFTNEQ